MPLLPNPEQFYANVWQLVRQVPHGRLTTYGQIAKMIAPPEGITAEEYKTYGSRWVGNAMRACPPDVPWQRVINAQGKVSARSSTKHVNLQQQILEREGIVFSESGKVDFARVRWEGPDASWLLENGFEFEQGLFGPLF